MNGLEIEIDNPLVPMELMPVKPLDYYNYDFLDPNGFVAQRFEMQSAPN